ncbi:MAG: hypothetical protein ACI87O_002696, partial [Planctomycetota bacterium]
MMPGAGQGEGYFLGFHVACVGDTDLERLSDSGMFARYKRVALSMRVGCS